MVLARSVLLAFRSVGVRFTLVPSGMDDVGEVVWVMVIRPPILVVLVVTVESDAAIKKRLILECIC